MENKFNKNFGEKNSKSLIRHEEISFCLEEKYFLDGEYYFFLN